MIASPSEHRSRLRGWWPLIIAGVIYALLVAAVVVVRSAGAGTASDYAAVRDETTSDFRDFWWTARHFREMGEITSEFGVHDYLPFFTIFTTPWSVLPLPVAAVLFTLLSLGLVAITVVLVEDLLGDGLGDRPRATLLITLGLALAYVHSCAVLGNVGLLLLFLVVTTWFLVERGREWGAGVTLGLATLIKLLPGVLILFFLLKRRWRVAGAAGAVTVVFGLGLPLATLGWEQTVSSHKRFCERVLRGHSAYQTILSEQPAKAIYTNNALPIVLRRLLSPVNGWPSHDARPLLVNIADLPRAAILGVYVVLMAAFVLTSIVVAFRGPPRWPPDNLAELRSLRGQFGVWCCLMLLASPLVWTHYLPLAYWPLALLADRAARTQRDAGRARPLSLAALLLWLLGVLLLAWPAARAAGAQLAAVACLWLALVLLAFRRSS